MWVGALIEDLDQKIILITEPGREEETITRLARVGYSGVVGYLSGGISSYEGELYTLNSISPAEFEKADRENVVDIRREGEFTSEHLEGAEHYPLDYMTSNIDHLDTKKTIPHSLRWRLPKCHCDFFIDAKWLHQTNQCGRWL